MGKQWKKIMCLVLTMALIGTNGIGDIPKSMAQTTADTEVSTDEGTYTIGSNADGEKEISLPESCTSLGRQAFYSSGLESIEILFCKKKEKSTCNSRKYSV